MAGRVLKNLLVITLIILALHLLMQYLNLVVYHEKHGQIFELSNRLDVDDEVSLPTWFAQFVLLAGGVCALLAARLERGTRRKAWLLIAIIGILFSIDEVGSIHELVLQSAHLLYYGEVAPTAALNAWWILLPLIGAVALWLAWWLYRSLPFRTWLLFVGAGSLYLIGAAGIDLISNDLPKLSYMYQGVTTALEEGFELVGSIVVLYGIIDYLESVHGSKLKAVWQELKPGRHGA